jgi:putative ABC transport system ATP-binding protein
VSVRVEGVSKAYNQSDKSVAVLKGLSFEVKQGESVAILGESGSGKSTLLALLAGLDSPDSGQIWIEDQSLVNQTETQLAKYRAEKLGIVFQQFHLMQDLTALENISLPLELSGKKDAKAQAEKMLESVGLAGRARHFPRELSGGECQRVAIARSLVSRPKLLLADEPTGNLDVKTAERVSELLFNLVAEFKSTFILVTHSEVLARRCHRTVRIVDGMIL